MMFLPKAKFILLYLLNFAKLYCVQYNFILYLSPRIYNYGRIKAEKPGLLSNIYFIKGNYQPVPAIS